MERKLNEAVFGTARMSVALQTDKMRQGKIVANANEFVRETIHFGYAGEMTILVELDEKTGKVEVRVDNKVVHSQIAKGWEWKSEKPQGESLDLRRLNRRLGNLTEALKKKSDEPVTYEYYIDLDERGTFRASVRGYSRKDKRDKVVFQIDTDEDPDFFEEGWMKHTKDIAGLEKYLRDLGVIGKEDEIVMGK